MPKGIGYGKGKRKVKGTGGSVKPTRNRMKAKDLAKKSIRKTNRKK